MTQFRPLFAHAGYLCLAAFVLAITGCQDPKSQQSEKSVSEVSQVSDSVLAAGATNQGEPDQKAMQEQEGPLSTATLGGGCFWCVEAILEEIDGIEAVIAGYMGGTTANPTYEQVCSKDQNNGHIEVVQVVFDPEKIDFDLLLEAFWLLHDPTSKDQQGNDKGVQYRSIIFYHDDLQKAAAMASIKKANNSGKFTESLITELREVDKFWPAEEYHQDYFFRNPTNGYCNYSIPPKLYKLFSDDQFEGKLKKAL